MSRFLTGEQLEIQKATRTFARKEIRPRRLEAYDGHEFITEMSRRCGELGMWRTLVPESRGGLGQGATTACLVIEELGRVNDRVDALRSQSAKWQQLLFDGFADISSDVDYDLRARSRGVLHGALMPLAWPNLLLGRDVTIYATDNTGRLYKLGYTLGVNGCGANGPSLVFTEKEPDGLARLTTSP